MAKKENKENSKNLREKDRCDDNMENSGSCKCGCDDAGCSCDCEVEETYSMDCDEEKEDYLEMAQRIQAEFDNYRKRSAETFKNLKQDGIIEAVGKFLPALDSMQKAKTMIKDKAVLEGIVLIEKDLKNSLTALEVEEINSKGKIYNPNYHNVIAVNNDNSLEDGEIIEVYQAGYKIKDKIIRYAQVIVNKKEV